MAGANATFGFMLVLLAAGLSSIDPGQTFLSVVRVIGGGFLVFLAIDALRENRRPQEIDAPGGGLRPAVRGVVAVLLNPGAYVFLATTEPRWWPMPHTTADERWPSPRSRPCWPACR